MKVFISHSVQDAPLAMDVCERLEHAAIPCWIAPRDIKPGKEWSEAILEAIERTSVLVVLLSRHSIDSNFVQREIECAVSAGKQVLPVRLDDSPLNKSLHFLLSSNHWLSLTNDEIHGGIESIPDHVRALLAESESARTAPVSGSHNSPLVTAGTESSKAETDASGEYPGEAPRSRTADGRRRSATREFLRRYMKIAVTACSLAVVAAIILAIRHWIDDTNRTIAGIDGGSGGALAPPNADPEPSPPRDEPPSTPPSQVPAPSVPVPVGATVPTGPRFTNSRGMSFVRIEPGTFEMGSPDSEPGRTDAERRFTCTITKPFYMGTTEVTRGQFADFVRATSYRTTAEKTGFSYAWSVESANWMQARGVDWRRNDRGETDRHPVTDVSPEDAAAFIAWLSVKDGLNYRLPSEAQWEYCYRAGTATTWPWGDDPDGGNGHGNAADESMKSAEPSFNNYFQYDDRHVYTSPVAKFAPNPLGIHDMFGNVREWCRDWAWTYPPGSATDPEGTASADRRIVRGSSFANSPTASRSANRARIHESITSSDQFGFRLVIEVD